MLGKMPSRQKREIWEYPTLGGEMRELGLEEIKAYIPRRQNTVAQYIDNCLIMDLYLYMESRPGSQTPVRWWYQEVLVIPGRPVEG